MFEGGKAVGRSPAQKARTAAPRARVVMATRVWAAPFLGPAVAVAVPEAQTQVLGYEVVRVASINCPAGRTTGSIPVEIPKS